MALAAIAIGLVVVVLAVDLLRAGDGLTRARSALIRTLVWLLLAVGWGFAIASRRGGAAALSFAGAYMAELALSVDNVAAFLAVFAFLELDIRAQRRALAWGILGAFVSRGVLILEFRPCAGNRVADVG